MADMSYDIYDDEDDNIPMSVAPTPIVPLENSLRGDGLQLAILNELRLIRQYLESAIVMAGELAESVTPMMQAMGPMFGIRK